MKTLPTIIAVLLSLAGCKKDSAPEAKALKAAAAVDAGKAVVGTGMPDCDALIETYAALAKCEKMPKESRDAMTQSQDSLRQTWGDPSKMSDDVKKSTNDGCKQTVESLAPTRSATGC
jgi:hypothetical protein